MARKSNLVAKKKPNCSDFIIAAIRTVRRKPANLKPKTAAGIALHQIFGIAREVYSDKEFRDGLKALIQRGTIFMSAKIFTVKKDDDDSYHHLYGGPRRLLAIPQNVSLGDDRWYLDPQGTLVNPTETREYQLFRSILLYVVADGLPSCAAKLVGGDKQTLAQQIIASMQKS